MSTPNTLHIELIVWHHRRRTARQPYSATAYLIDPARLEHYRVVEAGLCYEAGSEGEAARDALRDLQERCERQGKYDADLVRALADPVAAISERRLV